MGITEKMLKALSKKNSKPADINSSCLSRALLITYDISHLNHSKKTLFGYALRGRSKGLGVLSALKGEPVGRNSMIVPAAGATEIKEFLEHWKTPHQAKEIMLIKPQKQAKTNKKT